MTDMEKFIELYNSVGIEIAPPSYRWEESKEGFIYVLTLEAKTHPKVVGYSGFSTEIIFDVWGKFIEQNIWE